MESPKRAVRWLKSYWKEEDVWLYFEADEDGWVLRQVELSGAARTPTTAASLAEWPDANTAGIDAVRRYESKYGGLAEHPIPAWDGDFPHEEIEQAEFDALWNRARSQLEKKLSSRGGGRASRVALRARERQARAFTALPRAACALGTATLSPRRDAHSLMDAGTVGQPPAPR